MESGITVLRRSLPRRLSILNVEHVRFHSGEDAWAFEQLLLKVESIRHEEVEFQGGTELFSMNPLDYARGELILDVELLDSS